MFRKIIRYPGFWRSVWFLSFMYLLILLVLQWIATGFSEKFLSLLMASSKVWMVPLAGFIAGFMVTYGKFWARMKREEKRK
ncbi:MAG: hypothetical protein HKO54_01390 [Flavobacteriaceae bacterium]|nr:hypothetical protein [Flavobacteriaceae bacterium]